MQATLCDNCAARLDITVSFGVQDYRKDYRADICSTQCLTEWSAKLDAEEPSVPPEG